MIMVPLVERRHRNRPISRVVSQEVYCCMINKIALIILILLVMGSLSHAETKDGVLDVKGKAVVFFEPTEKEYKSLTEKERNELSEVLSDFYHYRDSLIPYLESNNIKPIITSDRKITVHLAGDKSRTYVRKKFKYAVGQIITDGKREPKVVLGVAGTDIDLMNDYKQYFKLK
jgi:hypothetical protein